MKKASFFVVGVGDIFPTPIDLRNYLMLLHFLGLGLIHILDLELGLVPIVQQVV